MKYDLIVAGVGGQGALSISAIIAASALEEGLHVKQSEVHGMSQRGGAVQANLRLSDAPIHSDLVPVGTADLLLSMEPLEALRYVRYLGPRGRLLAASEPVVNIPDYPELERVHASVRELAGAKLLDATRLAREAGSARATNMVIIGAASHLLPVKPETLRGFIARTFARKGEKVVEANLQAFEAGRGAVQWQES